MRSLHIDIESFSPVGIKAGVYRYAEEAEIILLAYAYDNEPTKCVDLLSGEEIPQEVFDDFTNPNVIKKAFNAAFERAVMQAYFNIELPVEQWQCTQALAALCGLPLNLEQVAQVLNIEEQKEKGGKALITYFCTPIKKPIKKNDFRERNLPIHAPEKWQQFKGYNVKDVDSERGVCRKLAFYVISEFEQFQWQLDQIINERGVRINVPFVREAIKMIDFYEERLMVEATALTGIHNPKSVAQLKKWLTEEMNEEITKLNKDTIPDILKRANSAAVTRLIEIRQESSKTSTKKYPTMMLALCRDGRVRGLHEYCGANRTSRAAGRLLQHQNLPRGNFENIEPVRDLVMKSDPDWLEFTYGPIPDTLSSLIRSALVPAPGNRFIISDYTSIEALMLACLSGEKWVIDLFKQPGKPKMYEATASRMFNVPIESVTKDLRQKGKVATLACVAKDSPVLTDHGLVPIQDVKLFHKLWDGNSWVSHKGVIFRGTKHTIGYGGLTATKDHLVWVEGQCDPIRFDEAAASGTHLLQSGNSRKEIRVGRNYFPRKKMESNMEPLVRIDALYKLPKRTMDKSGEFDQRKIQRMPKVFKTPKNTCVAKSKTNCSQTALRKSQGSPVQLLRRTGNRISFHLGNGSRSLSIGVIFGSGSHVRIRPGRQRKALRTWKFKIYHEKIQLCQSAHNQNALLESRGMALCLYSGIKDGSEGAYSRTNIRESLFSGNREEKELARDQGEIETFDILDCGPYNRFTVSNVLVHNCGFQGGKGALIRMGAVKEGLSEEELPKIVSDWRKANPSIVNFWYTLQRCAIEAIQTRQKIYVHECVSRDGYIAPNFGLSFHMLGKSLFFTMPSGRPIVYVNASLEEGEYGPKIVYWGLDQVKKKWSKQDTYSGKLAENATQSAARDILMNGLHNLHRAGYKTVLHVHDEAVCEMPIGVGSLEEVNKLMTTLPLWASSMPLKAAGEESFYYKK